MSVPADAGRPAVDATSPRRSRARSEVSNIDPTAAFPFGHGLSLHELRLGRPRRRHRPTIATDGTVDRARSPSQHRRRAPAPRSCSSTCTTRSRSVVRPVQRLIGYARVDLDAGEQPTVVVRRARRPRLVHGSRRPTHRRAGERRAELRLGRAATCRSRTPCGSSEMCANSITRGACSPTSRSRPWSRHPSSTERAASPAGDPLSGRRCRATARPTVD